MFRPLAERVLIKKLQAEEKTAGGVIIPSTSQDLPTEGIVIHNGTNENVKIGDRVMFNHWAGTKVTLEGVEHHVINNLDILGVFEDKVTIESYIGIDMGGIDINGENIGSVRLEKPALPDGWKELPPIVV